MSNLIITTGQFLHEAVQHAPIDPGPIAAGLLGWWAPDDDGALWWVCARCAGRLGGRGVSLGSKAEAVWQDEDSPVGVCCCCEK